MRAAAYAMVSLSTTLSVAHAQYATVTGRVVLRDDGQPLGFTTISVLSQGTQQLASDSGTIVLRNLPPGPERLRFRRTVIGARGAPSWPRRHLGCER
jgi:hypothetical protein